VSAEPARGTGAQAVRALRKNEFFRARRTVIRWHGCASRRYRKGTESEARPADHGCGRISGACAGRATSRCPWSPGVFGAGLWLAWSGCSTRAPIFLAYRRVFQITLIVCAGIPFMEIFGSSKRGASALGRAALREDRGLLALAISQGRFPGAFPAGVGRSSIFRRPAHRKLNLLLRSFMAERTRKTAPPASRPRAPSEIGSRVRRAPGHPGRRERGKTTGHILQNSGRGVAGAALGPGGGSRRTRPREDHEPLMLAFVACFSLSLAG